MPSEKSIIIKPDAYYKMLLHVLRFGNKARDRRQFKEVMGILIGHIDGEPDKKGIMDVIIEDAVPISHGGAIEVAFAPEDYITFSTVDEKYAEKGWFSCGWYHSHPGLDIFFSSTDIRNQLGWQTPFPSAIGIVFDHTFLEKPGELGFRTFRLDNPNKGQMSGYHEVKATVEPPDSIEYYLRLIELINSVHSKELPILEINEMPDIFGDITFPSESQIFAEKPEFNTSLIIDSLKNGLMGFLELSFNPIFSILNKWSENLIRNTVENNLQMRKDIIKIKDALSSSISGLQKDFKFSLGEKLNELEMYVDDKFEEFDTNQEAFKSSFNQIKTDLEEQFNVLFEQQIKGIMLKLLNNISENIDKLTAINTKGLKVSDNLEQKIDTIENLKNSIDIIEDSTLNILKKEFDELSESYNKNLNKIIGNFINLGKDSKSFLSDLKAAIILLESSKNPIQDKLDTLQVENKTLQKNIAELKEEKEELQKKLNNFEKGGD
ncbi:MAG: Mov34/MPN/PAD-1 family protein [Candidatus Hermodarchaeota archaeon]